MMIAFGAGADPVAAAPGGSSADRLWTTSGEADGLRVLVAEARTGYSWRTVAMLSRPGVETDRWIGNACITGSGDRAVVVYAPRTFTNREQLFNRGGFTAIVDLATGAVTNLPVRTSLAYFNPGCGSGETVALTQGGDADRSKTRLLSLDATSGRIGARVEVPGQVTSAIPASGGFVAAASAAVVGVSGGGKLTRLARTAGVPFHLHSDAAGGVVFEQAEGMSASVRRLAVDGRSGATTLASGRLGEIGVSAASGGRVFITGQAVRKSALARGVTQVALPVGAQMSTTGEAAVTDVQASPQRINIAAKRAGTGADLAFAVGREPIRAAVTRTVASAPGSRPAVAQDVSDPGAACAVRRNDPALQVYQPKPKQVEWAVDMAIVGELYPPRPPNWNHNGLPSAYTPQQIFPPLKLNIGAHETDGRVPAQVMLGILGQESNLWQASLHALPGEYGNPLIGNYYGVNTYNDTEADDWAIDWNEADCGYGVSQMTDGMRAPGHARPGETLLPHNQQVAVATDYATNVAAGLRLLASKWNQLQAAGVTLNDNNPARIENWFFAAWAYNSGYHSPGEPGANGASGLGWLNNPANPNFPGDRHPFGTSPRDFAHPQQWPYPEKVMGFAANPPSGFEAPGVEVPFFRAATWPGGDGPATQPGTGAYNRTLVKPPLYEFCVADMNNCDEDGRYTPNAPEVAGEPTGPCGHRNAAGQYDLKCWWHDAGGWKDDCAVTCGREFIRYDYPEYFREQPDGTSYASTCGWAGLPHDALVVDDIDWNTPSVRDFEASTGNNGCLRLNLTDSTFGMTFGHDAQGREASKIDLHQIGSGYGGHFWFSTTHNDPSLQISAKWTLNQPLRGRARVLARVPAHHTSSTQVNYTVQGTGAYPVGVAQGGTERWLDLGNFDFDNAPSVELTTVPNPATDSPVAFDAIAFAPTGDIEWQPEDKAIQLRNRAPDSGLCMATAVSAGVDWAWQRACLNNFSDDWMASLVGHGQDDAGFTTYLFQIRQRGSGKCLSVADQSTADGALVQQDWCTAGDRNQIWESSFDLREPYNGGAGSGTALKNLHSQKCLGVYGDLTSDGVSLEQRTCRMDAVPSQEWFWRMSAGG